MATKPRASRAAAAASTKGGASRDRSARARGTEPRIASPIRPTTRAKTYTSPPVDIGFAGPTHRFARADLEIEGIAHGEASYTGRVYFDNPKADADTPRTPAEGYAGAFHIFGHGGCVGDAGHCEINGTRRDPLDLRDPHPLTPARKRVTVTEALKAVAARKQTTTVTIVPIVTAATELCDTTNVFRCERIRFVSYNA